METKETFLKLEIVEIVLVIALRTQVYSANISVKIGILLFSAQLVA